MRVVCVSTIMGTDMTGDSIGGTGNLERRLRSGDTRRRWLRLCTVEHD
jgi:hypothetical protein